MTSDDTYALRIDCPECGADTGEHCTPTSDDLNTDHALDGTRTTSHPERVSAGENQAEAAYEAAYTDVWPGTVAHNRRQVVANGMGHS